MRKFVIILCSLFATVQLSAQNSQEILRELSAKFANLSSYSVDFAMSSKEGASNGSYVVSGDLFCIEAGAIELLYDGKTIYEIDHSTKEIALDDMGENYTFWSNPAQAFAMLDSRYDHQFEGFVESSGKHLYKVKLSAKNKGDEDFVLLVDSSTKLPFKVVYGQGDHSVAIRFVRIGAIEPNATKFQFDKEQYEGYELIDIRR